MIFVFVFVVIPFFLDVSPHLSVNMWTHKPGSRRRKATQDTNLIPAQVHPTVVSERDHISCGQQNNGTNLINPSTFSDTSLFCYYYCYSSGACRPYPTKKKRRTKIGLRWEYMTTNRRQSLLKIPRGLLTLCRRTLGSEHHHTTRRIDNLLVV